MFLLQARNLKKSFGARTLFSVGKLEIHDGDRIGLVGANGAGKSTLLNILCGGESADEGTVDRRCRIALVRQSGEPEGEGDGRLLREWAVADSARKSGGERTRAALAAAFSRGDPLLFADEPTTNLDLDGIERLQKQLCDYPGAVVLVSHDRALLDRVCTAVWAIEEETVRVFPGGYSDWIAERDRERAYRQFEYEQYRSEKARLLAEARSLREQARGMRKMPKRMGLSEARLHKGAAPVPQGTVEARAKALSRRAARLDAKERPESLPEVRMALGAAHPVTAKTAARIEGLTVRYGARTVLNDASFSLPTGSHTVMLGPNGAGKTTLVEHLMRGGDCARFASGVKAGYFSQNHEVLDPEKTVLENARADSGFAEHEVRTILANLGIAGDDVHKRVSALSGGERAKAVFARLLASDCNLLLLDEPTNHLDLYAAEALVGLLKKWRGTLLVVTHDRRLVGEMAERLLFVENGGVTAFEGGWNAWRAEQARLAAPRDDGLDDLIEQMRRAADAAKAAGQS